LITAEILAARLVTVKMCNVTCLALDRPPPSKQRGGTPGLSTRAEITATRIANEYHWGARHLMPLTAEVASSSPSA
jgi:hypothetical protein